MEIEARGVNIFTSMRKFHCDMRFVGALVWGEASVPVDAEQRSSGRAWIGHEMRRDVVEDCGKVSDESDCRLVRVGLVFMLVRLEPVTIVVSLQTREETEEI